MFLKKIVVSLSVLQVNVIQFSFPKTIGFYIVAVSLVASCRRTGLLTIKVFICLASVSWPKKFGIFEGIDLYLLVIVL